MRPLVEFAAGKPVEDTHVAIEGLWVCGWALGSGTPIVLVHGLGLSAQAWLHNLGAFATCGRVYAVDLPGFGRSKSPDAAWSPERQARCLARWCRAVGIRRAAFVGHSLGAEVCLWLAVHEPGLVERLVLAGPTGGLPRRTLLSRLAHLALDAVREPLHFFPVLLPAYWRAGPLRSWRTMARTEPERLALHLSAIQAPALVVWGADDPVVSLKEALFLADRLPNGRLLAIKGAAHGLIFDAPEAFNRAACRFLRADAAALRAPDRSLPMPPSRAG